MTNPNRSWQILIPAQGGKAAPAEHDRIAARRGVTGAPGPFVWYLGVQNAHAGRGCLPRETDWVAVGVPLSGTVGRWIPSGRGHIRQRACTVCRRTPQGPDLWPVRPPRPGSTRTRSPAARLPSCRTAGLLSPGVCPPREGQDAHLASATPDDRKKEPAR